VRLVGEVAFGDSQDRWEDWRQFEAVCNEALADLPLWSVCVYDTGRLPRHALDTAALTHPMLRPLEGPSAANRRYREPRALLAVPTAAPGPDGGPRHVVTRGDELAGLRQWVDRQLAEPLRSGGAAARARRGDFIVAVNEVATNGIRHGAPPVAVDVDVAPDRITCTVSDQGAGLPDALIGYTSPDLAEPGTGGRGLWLARHLCDRVTMLRSPGWFSVQLQLYR
jgi:anti-sigma regulatory factor (Ser/Thr protein kinase)